MYFARLRYVNWFFLYEYTKGRFREVYRKNPLRMSRPTSEMSNATISKHSDDENFTFDEFNFASYVESAVLKRFSWQSRT